MGGSGSAEGFDERGDDLVLGGVLHPGEEREEHGARGGPLGFEERHRREARSIGRFEVNRHYTPASGDAPRREVLHHPRTQGGIGAGARTERSPELVP